MRKEREINLNKFLYLAVISPQKESFIWLGIWSARIMLKNITLVCFFFGIIMIALLPKQSTAQTTEKIIESLQTASSKGLGKFFQESITLNMNNTLSDYSSNQAELVIRDFFRKYPVQEFKVLHQDESTDKSWHLIGKYVSGDNFKVLVKGTKENGKTRISSIEFSKE